MSIVHLIVIAYLAGSIPFGVIIARAHGKDLRRIGSGNIGATNLSRALNKKWAYFCFTLDVLKGLVPTLIAALGLGEQPSQGGIALVLAVGLAAVLGHIFPIYLKFKGGKGVATSFGIALGLWPYYTVCAVGAFIVWVVVVLISRYISLSSIAASIAFPVMLLAAILIKPQWQLQELWVLLVVAVAIPVMIVIRHRENLKRIAAGTESKIFAEK